MCYLLSLICSTLLSMHSESLHAPVATSTHQMVQIKKNDRVDHEMQSVPEIPSSLGCDHTLYLTQSTITPDVYQASHLVMATGVVQNGLVSIMAGEEIILEAGFEVKSNASFEAHMGPCTF